MLSILLFNYSILLKVLTLFCYSYFFLFYFILFGIDLIKIINFLIAIIHDYLCVYVYVSEIYYIYFVLMITRTYRVLFTQKSVNSDMV